MKNILLNALGLLLIIIAGYTIKRIGLVKKEDGQVLSKIIMNVTLPAAIIIGLNPITVNADFVLLSVIAIIMNVVLVVIGGLLWRKKERLEQALMMYCIAGYNIGNFTLPFIQSFYPSGVPFLFMFDVGNCIMLAGFTNILVEKMNPRENGHTSLRSLIGSLSHSMPFLTYVVMSLLRVLNLSIPAAGIDILTLFSKANGFLSLLMIGIYLELRLPKKELKSITAIIGWRYFFSIILGGLFYFVIPFQNPMVRIILTLISFAPIPTFAVINSVAAGIKEEVAGFISSISILISLTLMTLVLLLII